VSDYPDDWDQRRRDVYRCDDHTCQNCGAEDTELHAHHIQPVSEGGSHDAENLTTLCADCHAEAHDADICVICGGLAWTPTAVCDGEDHEMIGGVCDNCSRGVYAKRHDHRLQRSEPVPQACTFCGADSIELRDGASRYVLLLQPAKAAERFPLCAHCHELLQRPGTSAPERLYDRIAFQWEGSA
jgi:hypothetical protein